MNKAGKAAVVVAGTALTVSAFGTATVVAQQAYTASRTAHNVVNAGLLDVHKVGAAEDEQGWNCWTEGNRSCGHNLLTVPGEGFTVGTVLPGTDSFGPTVAWSNGPVWATVPRAWRYESWRICVTQAVGTDESLQQCDHDWTLPGEEFDMRDA